jgi:hypothetical protein
MQFVVPRSMFLQHLEIIRQQISTFFNHARTRTHGLAHEHAMCEFEKYVAHATCDYS